MSKQIRSSDPLYMLLGRKATKEQTACGSLAEQGQPAASVWVWHAANVIPGENLKVIGSFNF